MKKNISIEEISEIIYSGKKITVVTGAGVSVASGITPFRDKDGNYLIKDGEYSLSIECLSDKPEKFDLEDYLEFLNDQHQEATTVCLACHHRFFQAGFLLTNHSLTLNSTYCFLFQTYKPLPAIRKMHKTRRILRVA